jgi:hypothetical protein
MTVRALATAISLRCCSEGERDSLESFGLSRESISASRQPHLQAAQGWCELHAFAEADKELDEITPQLRTHPDVLEIRWHIYAHAKKWDARVDVAAAIIESNSHL